MSFFGHSNSFYYNILYVNTQRHSKKGVKHYSGRNSIYHYRMSCRNHYILY
nr:MAG TPA: hypothetical protein [Caudoviricetes sp.]